MNHEELTVATDDAPPVAVEVHGDLKVTGWDRGEVAAEASDEGVLEVQEQEGAVRVVCRSDLVLHVPSAAHLQVDVARGDVRIGAVTGDIEIKAVAGDLDLRDVGAVKIGAVSGDLSARHVAGDLAVQQVAADASIRAVDGALAAEMIGADLFLRSVSGDVSATVGADASLSLDPAPGRAYRVTAGSSIACRMPEDADAVLTVMSGSGVVAVRIPDVQLSEPADGVRTLTLGVGGPEVVLEAGGGVVISSGAQPEAADIGAQFAEDFGGMAEEITGQVEVRVEQVMSSLSDHLSRMSETLPGVLEAAGLSATEADRIAERVRESGERAAERAARRAERKAAKAARRAEKAARRAERKKHRKKMFVAGHHRHGPEGGAFHWSPAGRVPEREPVSDEERLAVLRMLEEGKITAEEAERLLRALGGSR
jgi:hypothetical protein